MSKITRILGLSLSLVMVLALVGGVSAQDKILHTGLSMVAGDVGTIDTAIAVSMKSR